MEIKRAASLFIGSGVFFLIANTEPQLGYLQRVGLCTSAAMILGGALKGNYALLCFGVGVQLVNPFLHCEVSPCIVTPCEVSPCVVSPRYVPTEWIGGLNPI